NGLAYCKMFFKNNEPSDFIYLDVNKSFKTLTGLKDVVGKKVTEVIPGIKESDPELFEIYGRVALTGEPEVFEMLVESLEDWFSVSVYSPQKEYFVAVFDVITERKKAEESLKESEEKYRLVIETAGEAIGIFDKNGKTIEVNQKMLELTGFKREELIGENLIETPKIKINLKQALTTFKDVTSGQTISNSEWDFTNLKGEDKTVIAHYTPRIKNGKLNGITLILENITELKRSEREILKSLGEKESLLREIHHRVNNNFQIISSLYNLQMEMVGTDCHDIIMASQSRIKSMAMVHEKVYQSTDLVHINYKQYIEKLLSDLFYMYGVEPGKIKTIMDIEDIQMGIDTAIPLGLIINELIVNSIRYAFPHANKGHIEVELKSNDDQYQLKIADDGVGLPENIDFKHPKTLGLQLVNTLISQIDGIVTLDNTNGTEFKIIFKESKYKERINQPY
ncbi:MAG TPA: PAS domain S-box protein, partial [Methanobacteriaceae archaeon]|nr:PAS domain S-box protein [Methanobacteriaceae archaeon]